MRIYKTGTVTPEPSLDSGNLTKWVNLVCSVRTNKLQQSPHTRLLKEHSEPDSMGPDEGGSCQAPRTLPISNHNAAADELPKGSRANPQRNQWRARHECVACSVRYGLRTIQMRSRSFAPCFAEGSKGGLLKLVCLNAEDWTFAFW